MFVNCETQADVDALWDRLLEAARRSGCAADVGLSWQNRAVQSRQSGCAIRIREGKTRHGGHDANDPSSTSMDLNGPTGIRGCAAGLGEP